MTTIDLTVSKKCAFCKYWYDPQNQAIMPKTPNHNIWSYDDTVRKKCLKRNLEVLAMNSCGDYECKIPIL